MSKIVSPYPPLPPNHDYRPPEGAQWWRFFLRPNDDGHLMMCETNGTEDLSEATWASWEFYDGEDTILDAGLDRPTPMLISSRLRPHIDILHVGPPTPSPHWEKLTFAGRWPHPEFNDIARLYPNPDGEL
jgi:hypothetical protein